ncbi:MAG TPA: class I SAM-dependent methyltransferase [Candidatus Polarisedimenticolaceae bacterium]|nr:class I SAM-dependent methyltransferase [Candidatus Polarisedimenticolaceae bacterium]
MTPEPALPTEGLRVKYRTRNPLARALVGGFLHAFDSSVRQARPRRVLEAGCGEGFLTDRLRRLAPEAAVLGLDESAAILDVAAREFPQLPLVRGSIYTLPCDDAAFDLVVACEVLEHLEDAERALDELRRATSSHVLLSVPREPLWRILNVLRGKYWSERGNTPGHLQHWSPTAFLRLVAARFRIVTVRRPLPWTMVLAAKR